MPASRVTLAARSRPRNRAASTRRVDVALPLPDEPTGPRCTAVRSASDFVQERLSAAVFFLLPGAFGKRQWFAGRYTLFRYRKQHRHQHISAVDGDQIDQLLLAEH